jgi:phosphoribosylanthranilate isomerase
MTGRIRVKICGVTTLADALACAEAGADLLGLNFYPPSPRYLAPDAARTITDGLRAALAGACPVLVGVFVNETVSAVNRIMAEAGLDAAQLSGDESEQVLAGLAGRAFKGIRPRDAAEARAEAGVFAPHAPSNERLPALLVDAYHKALYGGTGEQTGLDVALAARGVVPRLLLAGGLTPDNVAARVRAIQPWGVDVASGVESEPGIKDHDRVRAFIAAARSAERG